jgi:hypothetical protein
LNGCFSFCRNWFFVLAELHPNKGRYPTYKAFPLVEVKIHLQDSITQELLEKDSNSEAGKEPPAENEPPRGGKDSSDVGKEKEGSSSGVDNEEAGAVVGKEGGGAETTSHTPQKDGKIAAGDGKDESALDVVPESPRKEGAEEVAQQGNGIADHKDGTGSNRQIKGGKSGGKKKGKR